MLAQLSPNGQLIAVVSPSNNRVLIIPTGSSRVRTTLSATNGDQILQLFFPSDHQVVALYNDNRVVVWDLERGVVDYEIQAPAGTLFAQVVCQKDEIYILAQISSKLQIHVYRNGKLERKVRAGKKHLPRGLVVNDSFLAVRHEAGLQILKMDGKRVAKIPFPDGSDIVACGKHVCLTAGGKLNLVELSSGKIVTEAPRHAQSTGLYGWNNLVSDGVWVYKMDHDKMVRVCELAPQASLDGYAVLKCDTDLVVILQKRGNFQSHTLTLDDKVPVAWQEEETQVESKSSKRKAESSTTLGPAQSGGEAALTMQPQKRGRMEPDEDEGPTIEERLKQMREALDESDEDDEGSKLSPYTPKQATTESLTELVRQALSAGDDAKLELALQVVDTRIVTETCQQIEVTLLPTLLNALTTRLAAKPMRAIQLCVWIRAVLLTGRVDSAAHLQPLRNMIQERVEAFPALIQLEGRLSMIGRI